MVRAAERRLTLGGRWYTARRWWLTLVVLVACTRDEEPEPFVGCGDETCEGDENYITCPDDCVLPPPFEGDLAACAEALPQATIVASTFLLSVVDDDMAAISSAGLLVQFLLDALIAQSVATLTDEAADGPSDVSWDGAGTYTAIGDDGTTVVASFQWGAGFETAPSGTPILEDLFAPGSYLANATVDVDPSTLDLLISFDETGPLVELLGYGPAPTSPVRLSLTNLVLPRFDDLLMTGTSTLGWTSSLADVSATYDVSFSPQRVGDALAGLDVAVLAIQATLEEESVVADRWDVRYLRGSGIEGTAEARKTGGELPLASVHVYEGSTNATRIELSCPAGR